MVSISSCKFQYNSLLKQESKTGGSSIYFNVVNGKIRMCKFSKGSGGCSLKLINDNRVSDSKSKNFVSKLNENSNILITNCNFDVKYESHNSAIFYYGGKSDQQIEIKKCCFKGKLLSDLHYFDGILSTKNSTLY